MKKFYTFAAALAICCAANAQELQLTVSASNLASLSSFASVPVKADATDDLVTWGYYTGTDDLGSNEDIYCVGLNGTSAAEYYVGVKIPCNDLLKDAELHTVLAPVYDNTTISGDYTVSVLDGTTVLASKSIAGSELKYGSFGEFEFDTPVKITKDLIVCYHLTTQGTSQAAIYPIFFDSTVQTEGSFLIGDSSYSFKDYSASFGALVTKFRFSGISMEDANATFSAAELYTQVDTDNTVSYTINSNGKQAVKEIEYTISVAGAAPETRTAKVSIPSGFNQSGTVKVDFHSPVAAGDYNVDMAITKVNGIDNAAAGNVTTSTCHNLNRIVDRNVVMEEFTGTGCGYCPRGYIGMKRANDTFGDRFIGIAIHNYNSTDPMYLGSASYPLSFQGAPSSYIDRASGEVDPGISILPTIEARFKEIAGCAVTPTATFSEDYKTVNVSADIDAVAAGTYEIVFVLTADGLTGTAFKQSNYYYQYTASQWGISDEEMAKFCSGGEWGKSSVQLTYDDAAIATSYKTSANKGGSVTLAAGEVKNVSYTLTMPTKTALLTAIKNSDYDVYAVVLALAKDGTISNAGKCKVQAPAGINEIAAEGAHEVARYTLDGRRITNATAGVNIIRMSDGTSKTVIVK